MSRKPTSNRVPAAQTKKARTPTPVIPTPAEPPLPPEVKEDDPAGLGLAIEIIRKKLYFASISSHPQSTETRKYFTIDYDLVYEPYFADFGPLHLGHVVRFCRALRERVQDLPPGADIVFYTSHHGHQRANAGCLIACYCVAVLGMSPTRAWSLFDSAYPPFLSFRDASYGVSTFSLTIFDIISGLHKAMQLKWFDVDTFDLVEYTKYEQVEEGDWQWIVPNRIIAFSSPIDDTPDKNPERLIKAFRERSVHLVIRLNERLYDKRVFTEVAIRHLDLPFTDGGVPSDAIVSTFFENVEKQFGAFAVHCKAGLGRTGTMIGLYCMKHYGLSAREFIGWCRLCRPGCVAGQQQHYLVQMEKRLSKPLQQVSGGKLPFMTPTEAWKLKLESEEAMYSSAADAGSHRSSSTATTVEGKRAFKYPSSAKLYKEASEMKKNKEKAYKGSGPRPLPAPPLSHETSRRGTQLNSSSGDAMDTTKGSAASMARNIKSAPISRPQTVGPASEVLHDLLPPHASHAGAMYESWSSAGDPSSRRSSLPALGGSSSSSRLKMTSGSANSFMSSGSSFIRPTALLNSALSSPPRQARAGSKPPVSPAPIVVD